jgi:hypothetical protein
MLPSITNLHITLLIFILCSRGTHPLPFLFVYPRGVYIFYLYLTLYNVFEHNPLPPTVSILETPPISFIMGPLYPGGIFLEKNSGKTLRLQISDLP